MALGFSACGAFAAGVGAGLVAKDFVDGFMSGLIPLKESEGFKFALNDDNASYSLIGIGTCTDTDVVIPATYEGLPVTTIGFGAFFGCDSLTSVVIPDSVTTIGSDAFYCCSSLTSVVIPDSVTTIGSYAFYNCSSLTSVVIGDSVTTIGSYAFYNCSSLTSVVISDSVTTIGKGVFLLCSSLTSVVIPDGVTTIGHYAFYNCSSLTSVEIPDSVTTIGDYVFSSCSSLKTVYYKGTASGWSNMSIGYSNAYLTDATRYYYSETKPTTTGNYWHYVDGVETPW